MPSRATARPSCAALEGEPLSPPLAEAAQRLATAAARTSTRSRRSDPYRPAGRPRPGHQHGDPDARHGHKTSARGFDGYKAHVALDPDGELVTATAVTPGNAGDASVALALLATELAVPAERDVDPPVVYGDAAYGTGPLLATLEAAGVVSRVKIVPASQRSRRPLHQG